MMPGMHRACLLLLISLIGTAAGAESTPSQVMRIVSAPSGLWATGYGKGIWHYADGRWRQVANGEEVRYATDLTVGPGGKLYVAIWMGKGIAVLDPRSRRTRLIRWPEKMPGFNRGHRRATRIAYDGRNILVNTFAGIGCLGPGERWTWWGGLTEMDLLFADGTGCWTVMNNELIHIDRAGAVDYHRGLNGFLKKDMRLTSLWADAKHALIGDKRGVLFSLRLQDGKVTTVAGPPPGITGALMEILPVGQTIYLAYGWPGFPGEGKIGGLAVYDRLTGHLIASDALKGRDWRSLLLARGQLWLGGSGGVRQIAPPHLIPTIARAGGTHVILLPDIMRVALRRYDPAFTPCPDDHFPPSLLRGYQFTNHQAPFAVIGDFNGDGRQDVALQGHAGKNFDRLVIFAGRTGARVLDESRSEKANDLLGPGDQGHLAYLEFVPRGTYRSHWEAKPLHLGTDAVTVAAYEKAATICYYRTGRFHQYITAD